MIRVRDIIILVVLLNLINFSVGLSKHPLTIVLSFDGFHYKYFKENLTPTLLRLKEKGTSAVYMNNVFPTKTFPNHFTAVTGRYVEEHGVLDSEVFDQKLNKNLHYSEELFTYKKTIQPIWMLNENAGNGRYSGIMMWPSGEFNFSGTSAKFKQPFDGSISFERRIDKILEWILHSSTPANLIFSYFEEPDLSGHVYGPNSKEMESQLKKCDDIIKYLQDKLNCSKVKKYNLIILSDHGMSNVYYENIINLDTLIDKTTYDYYGTSPNLQIYPRPDQYDKVLTALKTAAIKKDSHFRLFTKDSIPEIWHYKHCSRTPPLLLIADVGYVFSDILKTLSYFEKTYQVQYGPGSRFGTHGYEPNEDMMHAVFIASGPAFKTSFTTDNLNNIDLYSLFAKLLNVKISPDSHSGNETRINCLLANSYSNFETIKLVIMILFAVFGLVSLITWVNLKR